MKTTVFELSEPRYEPVQEPYNIYDVVFHVPILPAYSILHYSFEYYSSNPEPIHNQYESAIELNTLRIKSVQPLYIPGGTGETAVLTIHYSGIRDYRLYFPHVENALLRNRLAEFAEEAEKCFDSAAWMSFTVMVASVVEGLLINCYAQEKLFALINRAKSDSIFSESEADLLHEARKIRNRVHAGKFEQEFPDRKIGNDLYVLYDKLIKKKWV